MDQLRVLAYLDLLNGISPAARIARARAEATRQPSGDDPPGQDPGGSGPGGGPGDGLSGGSGGPAHDGVLDAGAPVTATAPGTAARMTAGAGRPRPWRPWQPART
jgi:hypothetical protein